MAAFDDLETPPRERPRPTQVNQDPFGDSFFNEPSITAGNDEQFLPPRAAARREHVRERMKAEDLSARGIPFFKNASGGVSAVTDESGAALTNLDARHNIAYDSKGQPKLIAYGEEGPPLLKDPFEGLKPQTDPKTGAIETYGPGGLYRYDGQDPVIAGQLERKARDKSIAHESTLLGRKLTLDEHDLRTGESDMKVMKNELRTQVPILLDPKYEGADRETVLGAIDQHFDTQYASPEANSTRGWFGRDLAPEANTRRAEIDQAKAKAREAANAIFDHQERLEGLRTTVDETRSQERANTETLLAHARGQEGPLDQPAVPQGTEGGGKPAQLYPERKEWARMLGGDKAVDDMLGVVRKGDVPAPAAPAVLAATHDLKDAQAKAAAVKDSDPTLYEQYSNVAASILHGLTQGLAEIYKGSMAEPGWSTIINPLQQHGLITSGIMSLFSDKSAKQLRSEDRAKADAVVKQTESFMDERLKDSIGSKVGNFVGGIAPYVAAAFATKGTSVATPLMASLFYTSGYQRTLEDAQARGVDPAKAEAAAVGVGAINAVLAMPLRTVGKAAEAIFGDSAPKVIERAITNAYEHGGSEGVYRILSGLAQQIKAGGLGTGAKAEVHEALTKLMAEITKPAAQRALDVAKTAAGHAALGAGVQTSENLIKKTYNPDQGTFEGVPEQAIGFGALGALSKGFEQIARARKAKQALDLINKRGGGPAEPPQLGPGGKPAPTGPAPTEKPVTGTDRTVSPTTEKPAKGASNEIVPKQRNQPQNQPAGGEPKASGPPAAKPSDASGAVVQQDRANATGQTPGETAVAKRNVVETGDTLAEGDKKFTVVSTGGKAGGSFIKVRPIDQPDAKPIIMGGTKVANRIANNELIHTKAAASTAVNNDVDKLAHTAATSPTNGLPEPSQAQKEAGNYQKGHVKVAGLDISIENPAGSRRKEEYRPLESHYGYIKGTVGADKDHVDIFIKQGTPADYDGPVYVVNQVGKDGKFDEHKAVLGVHGKAEALAEYHKNYQPGWKGAGTVATFKNPEAFKQWATTGPKGQPAVSNEKPTAPTAEDQARHGSHSRSRIQSGQRSRGETTRPRVQRRMARDERSRVQGSERRQTSSGRRKLFRAVGCDRRRPGTSDAAKGRGICREARGARDRQGEAQGR
jgi:hypothetical protein